MYWDVRVEGHRSYLYTRGDAIDTTSPTQCVTPADRVAYTHGDTKLNVRRVGLRIMAVFEKDIFIVYGGPFQAVLQGLANP